MEAAAEGIEVIFHLAALVAIPYSYVAPESFVDTNVRGTLNVLEAARRAGVRRLVHTSTSEVYGTPSELPIRETHPLQAQSPYAASKLAADQFALAFQRSFDLPVVVLRPFNTYGPRQSERAVLPTILRQLLSGSREIRLGRLDPRRDLTYVADTVDGFVRAAITPASTAGSSSSAPAEANPSEISWVWPADCSEPRLGRWRTPRGCVPMPARSSSWRQTRRSLERCSAGRPRTTLEDGLRLTIDWLRTHPGRSDVDRVQL